MYQSLTLIGRLGKDPETRSTQAGEKVTKFSIAVSEWDGKKKEERTQWFDCVLWGDTGAKLSDTMRKGDRIMAEGRIRSRKWKDKEDVEHISWEVSIDRHRRIDFKKAGEAAKPKDDDDVWEDPPAQQQKPKPAATAKPDFEDDIPW